MYIRTIQHTYPNFHLSIENLSLNGGKIIGLVGENGAGKTTLMNLLSGFLKANQQFDVTDHQPEDILFIPSDLGLYDYLTVAEFAQLVLENARSTMTLTELLDQLELTEQRNHLISELSQGRQKKLTLINLFTKKYKFLILDEPFNSIDMNYVYNLKKQLKKLSQNVTILISSHILDTLSDLCDEFVYLKKGTLFKVFKNSESNTLEREIFEQSV